MLTKEDLEDYGKNRLKELIEKGEKPAVVAGFIDYFGNATIMSCSRCGVPVFVRPWIAETVIEHGLLVICICCVNPQNLKGQVAWDLAKIEEKIEIAEKRKRSRKWGDVGDKYERTPKSQRRKRKI